MGRGAYRGMVDGNVKILSQINEILGYDFTPHFADLWTEDSKDWEKHRKDYHRAIAICLEKNYYGRLSEWCANHGIALTGHPAKSMDLGAQKYFQIPGQDLVWRYVVPGKTALVGEHSTMAKNASSAMVHLNRRRNSNELYGAYGHELTHDEMVWLANWCFVRGHNLLYPHAFYYSVRGARFNERPPDVGPNAKWWGNYKEFADACRRLSWLNTDSKQVCEIAVIGDANWLPDRSPKVLFQNQLDFNYLEMAHLGVDAIADKNGVHIAGMEYKAVILDGGIDNMTEDAVIQLKKISENGRLIIYEDSPLASKFPNAVITKSSKQLVDAVEKLIKPDIKLTPSTEDIRYRHVVKEGTHYYMFFNENETVLNTKIDLSVIGGKYWLNQTNAKVTKANLGEMIVFQPHEMKVLMVEEM
ncbi:MAG: hypothetical protein HOG79_03790 [Prolixibacteraceae bacterium]|nr:hypothetical protein [Prolixibacteraceae bacterium]